MNGPAFREGVTLAADRRLLSNLFGERAALVLGLRDAGEVAAHISGLLIGANVSEQAIVAGEPVHILADPGRRSLYTAAVVKAGGKSVILDSHAALLAGITAHLRKGYQKLTTTLT